MSCPSFDSDYLAGAAGLVMRIDFEANNGRRWQAIGGGRSLDEAIAFARESAPAGQYWRVVRVADLYGD